MGTDSKPLLTEVEYLRAMAELERLWGSKSGTPEGDQLDDLAASIDAYESKHYPMGSR